MTELTVRPEGAVFSPSGPLTFATVADLARRLAGIPPRLAVTVDLAAAGEADSSALALFVEIGRRVGDGGGSLEFRNVPDAVRRIAGVYGLESLFDPGGPIRTVE